MANSNITVCTLILFMLFIYTSFSTVWLVLWNSLTFNYYYMSTELRVSFFSRKHAVGLDLAIETLKSWFCSEIRSDAIIYFFDIIIRWSLFFKQRQVQFSKIWPIFDFSNVEKKVISNQPTILFISTNITDIIMIYNQQNIQIII